MKKSNKLLKIFGVLLCALILAVNFSPAMQKVSKLPKIIYYENTNEKKALIGEIEKPFSTFSEISTPASLTWDDSLKKSEGFGYEKVTVELFGIPIKTVYLHEKKDKLLIPCGTSVGVSVYTEGVLVVGTSDVSIISGETKKLRQSPAEKSGIRAGDVLISANGEKITSTDSLIALTEKAKGAVDFEILRDEEEIKLSVKAEYDENADRYMLGMWVRDSTAGIGTVTFYDPKTSAFAALGHAITDVDTGTIFEVGKGIISRCDISDVSKGQAGKAGELIGSFNSEDSIGNVYRNCSYGIYGRMENFEKLLTIEKYKNGIPLAYPDEVKEGAASMLATIKGRSPKEYSCKITKLYAQKEAGQKGFVCEITDSQLIEATGGIVQGMSGSPIIQNGKIIGAITHVMINEPKKGYCMYAYWMEEIANKAG